MYRTAMQILDHIQKLQPYNPPLANRRQFEGLRLDFNERLAPLPATMVNELQQIDWQMLRTYPAYDHFVESLAAYANVASNRLMISNGSDHAIEVLFKAIVSRGDCVLTLSPTFPFYRIQIALSRAEAIHIPLALRSETPQIVDAIVQQLTQSNIKLLVLCNPNSPTGTMLTLEQITHIVEVAKQNNSWVYIDEAYYEFSGITALRLIAHYDNIIITRTFSKAFGLAALRLGYLISQPQNVKQLQKVRGPYDINQIAVTAGLSALKHKKELLQYCDLVRNQSYPLVTAFFDTVDVQYFESTANFIYFVLPKATLIAYLQSQGILIRKQADCFARVSLGTPAQMQTFIDSCQTFITNNEN